MRTGAMRAAVGVAAWLVVTGTVAAADFQVELTIREPAGVAHKSGPARGGIPLPAGMFKKGQPFAVFADGTEVPAQVLPLVVDEKGFLRWILVDLQTDLAPNEAKELVLKAVKGSARPASPVRITEADAGVTVDTGKIRFAIAKDKPFGLFTSVAAGGKPVVVGGEVSYTDVTNPVVEPKRYLADKPDAIETSYAGPMRVTLKVTGRFKGDDQSKLRYIARITAWAGRSDVHVKYSLANSNPDHYVYRRISDSSIALKLAGAVRSTVIGADKPIEAESDAWIKQGLMAKWESYYSLKSAPGATIVGSGTKELWKSTGLKDIPVGWIAARTAAGTVSVCDRFLSDNPARSLAVEKGSLVLRGVIERFEGKTGSPYRTKVRWLLDSAHLSSEYVIDFAAPSDGQALADAGLAARHRLHVMAPPAWYSETEGLEIGKFGTQADELNCYDLWGWKHDKAKAPKSARRTWRYTAGVDNHYDSEGDVLEGLVLMYLRTGSRPFFEHAQAWANHGMDLRLFRTDGWRYKDGGVWWTRGGPAGGNRPQRPGDPVTGLVNYLPPKWSKGITNKLINLDAANGQQMAYLADARQCNCHNYGAGIAAWFCITGDRDAFDATIDNVEQQIDTQRRAFRRQPGVTNAFSRDFTRACRGANAGRLVAPADPFVVEASDFLARAFLQRPRPEPRGLIPAAAPVAKPPVTPAQRIAFFKTHVGDKAIARMAELGVKVDPGTGALVDPKTGNKWNPVVAPHSFMYPPLYRAIDSYYRLTGSEDAQDWVIAHGKAFAQILYQRHGNFVSYSHLLVDFPLRGICVDKVSWDTAADNTYGEGVKMSGYTARHWPDAPAKAYSLCGEPLLKQRGYDYWFAGSHRGYQAQKMHNLGGVGMWVNYNRPGEDTVGWSARTFYEHAHPRTDAKPPVAVKDLAASFAGDTATVTFTAPRDEGGGKVARYQVKCSGKRIVSYEDFLEAWKTFDDGKVTNWWMATNLTGEPAPRAGGAKETFTVNGVPEGARYFAVRTFDDSANRSALSNVVVAPYRDF